MSPVRVLLVAQSPVLRYGIRGTLESAISLGETVEATGAIEAAALFDRTRPALTVIHDALPGVTANVTAKMLQDLQPGSSIAILSDFVDEGHRANAEQHGATALVSLAAAPVEFAAAIRAVVQNGRGRLTDRLVSTARVAGLAALEIAVLDGLVRGRSVGETAATLHRPEPAILECVTALIGKLGAADLPSAVVAAVRLGLANLTDQLPAPPASLTDVGVATAA